MVFWQFGNNFWKFNIFTVSIRAWIVNTDPKGHRIRIWIRILNIIRWKGRAAWNRLKTRRGRDEWYDSSPAGLYLVKVAEHVEPGSPPSVVKFSLHTRDSSLRPLSFLAAAIDGPL